jgi:putative CocE/NonD family hydrolase
MNRYLSIAFAVPVCLAGVISNCFAQDSQPYRFLRNVPVPMRDGIKLAANVYLPNTEGRFPVILMRTPYGKPQASWDEAKRYTAAGYAMVVQDCRGRGNSQGVWDPFRYDVEDGYDTQEWVGRQAWCNGRIGTAGGSYVGWTQWASAPNASKYLTAMVPIVPFGDVYRDIAYPGGAFQLALLFGWGAGVGGINLEPSKLNSAYKFMPLDRWDEQFNKEVNYLNDWIQHATYDDYWRRRGIRDQYESISVPILNIGGWYDIFSKTTLDLVDQVRERSKDRMVRRNQYVVIGPWGHGVGGRKVGEIDFGESARMDIGSLQFKWFEYWLKDQETDVENWPAYYLFVMGENRWRGENEWPLARTRFVEYYLHSQGNANSRQGDGELSTEQPGNEPPDQFTYDPANPVPTHGGNNLVGASIGPFDQSAIETRPDVLVYSTPVLTNAIEATGPIQMVLYAATSALDTDFTAKLVDVHPDGKAYNLADGIVRARYRNGLTATELVEPGKIYRYEIDLWVTSNVFLPGHRIRVEISSSNFPRFDRNPNSGKPFGTDTELLPAKQTIFHDSDHASYLRLPVI